MTLKPLDVFGEARATSGRRVHGEVMVASLVTLYKKLKFVTDENVGWGPIDLPEIELQTTAYWLTADSLPTRWNRNELDVALIGAGRAIQTIASVLLMVDPRDLGLVAQVRSPHQEAPTIYLYEAVPGGIGMSERLWQRHEELIAGAADLITGCACDGGLPGLHRPAARARHRREGARAAVPPRGRGGSGGRGMSSVHARAAARELPRRGPAGSRADGHGPAADDGRGAAARGGDRRRSRRRGARGRRALRADDRRPAGRPRARLPACRASRRRTCRSSASTPRPPGSRPRPGRWRSSSGSAGGRATGSGRSQLILPDQPDEPAMLAMIEAHIPPIGVARDVQRPRLRLAAARDPLPDGPPARAGPRRAPRPAAVRPARVPPSDGRRAAPDRRDGAARRRAARGRRGLADPGPLPRLPAGRDRRAARRRRPPQPRGRPVAGPAARRRRCPLRRRDARSPRRTRATSPGSPAPIAREGRLDDALACLDAATSRRRDRAAADDDDWWLPQRPVDYGGRPTRLAAAFGPPRVDSPWTEDRILVERARLLRRLGRFADAAAVWEAIGAGAGPLSAHAWIEVAKLREHRLRDLPGAFAASERAWRVVERRRQIGRFDPALDEALAGRLARLGRRLEARRAAERPAAAGGVQMSGR